MFFIPLIRKSYYGSTYRALVDFQLLLIDVRTLMNVLGGLS
jgi:hypothetical protein